MIQPDALASVLVDHALAEALVPWPCPSDFGPDGRYRLEEVIGAGQDSIVYRAKDRRLSSEGFDAAVALKISRHAQSVRHDALSARRIVHPNVLSILDQGVTEDGAAYLVSELVEGGDLSEKDVPIPPREAARFIAKLARGVHAAHSAGVVHCDLKPANILLTTEGEPKLADFDLARWASQSDDHARGNIAFMSPEQFRGERDALSPPSDIYALGGLLFYLLTGKLPNGQTRNEVAVIHATRTEPPSPGKNRTLDQICRRAMAIDRHERHDSAAQLADDLDAWLEHRPIEWLRPGTPERAFLWARRHPVRALAAAVAFIGVATAFGIYQVEVARAAQIQARSNERTKAEVEIIKARVRDTIRKVALSTLDFNGRVFVDRALPTIVWLEWLVDSPVLDDDVRMSMSGERNFLLRTLIDQAEVEGRAADLDIALARYSLAHFLVREGESTEPEALLAEVRRHWGPRLDPNDQFWECVSAVELCAAANGAFARGEPMRELRNQLYDLEARLLGNGRLATVQRLISHTLNRITEGK